jgi:DNA mismatch repair protein MutS2
VEIEEKIGFDKIRELVANECTNALAVQMSQEMSFSDSYQRVMKELQQTEEMRQLIMFETGFPGQDFYDLTDELHRLSVQNTVITQQALFDMKSSLRTLTDCLRFLLKDDRRGGAQPTTPRGKQIADDSNAEQAAGEQTGSVGKSQEDASHERYPQLFQLAERVELDANLLKTVNKLIDEKGEIYDSASDELMSIRRQMQRKRSEVDDQVSRSLSRAKREGWSPENAEVTIRNGRLVIPMLDTHRRKMKGIIQDESATRQTAYLEPAEVVELNNDLRELEFAERHEIQKILMQFSDYLRPQLPALVNAYWFLACIDFIRAKARLALTLHAGLPIVEPAPKMNWLDARHPLLYLSKGDTVVPFSMQLSAEQYILIISGPNAGGKSVCLKAVGLIQYMLQAGLLVPCRETSEFGIFGSIFIDIGDQQSIENDLSTYSSHLKNMRQLLEVADGRTLFLMDELGGGTEPRSGCAIAEAVLEELYRRRSFGVVTTHYADLKLMADKYEGIINGAMLFDTERMVPLYRLAIGHPGSSFAFEMATNIGLPISILEAAEQKVGTQMINFEHQLQQMELDKQELARQRNELSATDNFLNEVVQKYQRLSEQLETKKFAILSEARQEAKQILSDANRTVERTIADIKESQAEKQRTQQAREQLAAATEKVDEDQHKHLQQRQQQQQKHASALPLEPKASNKSAAATDDRAEGPIAVNDIVRIDDQQSYAQVVAVKGRKAIVESNNIRMTIPMERLTRTNKKHLPSDKMSKENTRFQSIFDDLNEKRGAFKSTLDLRGHRAEEALVELQHFLDDAKLLSEHEVRILHGKGFGILKTLIRQELQRNPEVKSFHSERMELGGEGITIVNLK